MINFHRLKILFRPICWITEIYYTFRYVSEFPISGHSFIECDSFGNLECEICGIIVRGEE
jgi:hypothetical protein